MDEEDLYDGLYEDVGDIPLFQAPFQSFQENDTREEEFQNKEAELNGKVESLLKEVETLQQEKAVLTRNISCLFKTAQMELARKDKQMKELRDENSRFKLGGKRGPTNGRPHWSNPACADKVSGLAKMTIENIHHDSTTVGAPDARASDHSPHSQGKRIHGLEISNDRVTPGSSSIHSFYREKTNPCGDVSLMTTSEATTVNPSHEQAVEMGNSEQCDRSRRPDSLHSARVSARIREPDAYGQRQSSDEGRRRRSPHRGLHTSSDNHRDTNSDGSRRAADKFEKQRGSSNDKDSRSDRQRGGRHDDSVRSADYGHTKLRSPEWNRDILRGRSTDERVDGNMRNLDNRKRHRSLSREKDGRPKDRESLRAAKTIYRSGSESSRERQKEHSNSYQR